MSRIPRRRSGHGRWPTGTVVAVLAAGLVLAAPVTQAVAASTTTIAVDGSSGGLVFDGDGAISGGGGNTRLLADYPAAQQGAILDYLFKPGYGAQVQILKLELGGSGNSTSGAEPSFEETKGHINCAVGYEFGLAEQAVARNPAVRLYGLPATIENGAATLALPLSVPPPVFTTWNIRSLLVPT